MGPCSSSSPAEFQKDHEYDGLHITQIKNIGLLALIKEACTCCMHAPYYEGDLLFEEALLRE